MRFFVLLMLLGATAGAGEIAESEKSMEFEVKLGPYKPFVDRRFPDVPEADRPYQKSFNGAPMLIGEIEIDKQLWQAFGTLAVAFSLGYAEKFGKATDAATGVPADESTGIRLVPMKALAVYRWDYPVAKWNVPLVPYLKTGIVMAPWWVIKGQGIEVADGVRGAGVKWGLAAVFGLALQLDFLDPRLARDFDSSAGVNHTYLFAEYAVQELSFEQGPHGFGSSGLDLSSHHWMFGLSFEF